LHVVLGKINRLFQDKTTERVLVDSRQFLLELAIYVESYARISKKFLKAASDEDLRIAAPVVGHFMRGFLGKVARGLHEEAVLAFATLNDEEFTSGTDMQEAIDDAEAIRAQMQVELVEARKSSVVEGRETVAAEMG
jgi:hypothetical protein